ncbi:VirB4-like conjugal transfer ATPase, CD1110 family [Kineococcus sp. SYSU DK003]|uniref:VirB4-like conjugal transfer ATPase, CD1110 family n=1 Tax=Kineococcus sp. SYSU DK003 TaxID=3383124 RepID=UPI003D7CD6DB
MHPAGRFGKLRKWRLGRRNDDQPQRRHSPRSTQSVLAYEAMLDNGVAWLGDESWSVTAEIGDISYTAAPQEVQEKILNRWARWLNSFSPNVEVQQSVVNTQVESDAFGRMSRMQLTGDDDDEWREEFNKHTRHKLSASRGNVLTGRYLTFTLTHEPDAGAAQQRLAAVINETATVLRNIGCEVRRLERAERLELLSGLVRPGAAFQWDEQDLAGKKTSSRDLIAPWTVQDNLDHLVLTSDGRQTFHTTIWLRRLPAWLSDRVVADLADVRGDLVITTHLRSYDAAEGLDLVNGQIANLEMQYLDEVKKAKKANYSLDLIPHVLTKAREDALELRKDLEGSNQRLWSTQTCIGLSAPSKEALDALREKVTTKLRGHSCTGEVVSWMCLDGLRTVLPLGARRLPMERTLTTSVVAMMHPFAIQELMQPTGCFYGVNTKSGNPILADRTTNANGNGFFLGMSGYGKSQAAKAEILWTYLNTDDDIIIIDPEREYLVETQALHGQIIGVSPGGSTHINALDIDLDTTAENPITAKCTFVLHLVGALIGGADGLSSTMNGCIDRSTARLLRAYAADPDNVPMPTLTDLRDDLAGQEDPVARELAAALDIYTDGSLGAFAQQTNVQLNNRLTTYDISQLSSEMKVIGMSIILNQVWQRVTANRAQQRRTWLYIDEFHMMFRVDGIAQDFLNFYQVARKWGLMMTGITQNIEELLNNDVARYMIGNTDFLLLLNQAPGDADTLREMLRMSETQREFFQGVLPGTGLLKSGNAYIPFDNQMVQSGPLYKLLSTKFGEQ